MRRPDSSIPNPIHGGGRGPVALNVEQDQPTRTNKPVGSGLSPLARSVRLFLLVAWLLALVLTAVFGEFFLFIIFVLAPAAAYSCPSTHRACKRTAANPTRPPPTCCRSCLRNAPAVFLVLLLIAYTVLRVVVLNRVVVAAIYTGYFGKQYCSGIFVSGRTMESIRDHELLSYHEKFKVALVSTDISVDKVARTVTISCLDVAFVRSVKVWKYFGDGFGCHLTSGFTSTCTGDDETCPRPSKFAWTPRPARSGASVNASPLPENLSGDVGPVPRQQLDDAMNMAFAQDHGTLAMLASVNGTLIAERYASKLGVTRDSSLLGWSMSKTMGSLFLGLRVRDGAMGLDDFVKVPELDAAEIRRRNMTARSLVYMHINDPLPEESYDMGKNAANERMLFGSDNFANFANVYYKRLAEPWTHFEKPSYYYSSGTTNTLSRAARLTFADDDAYWSEMRNELLRPIGAGGMTIETDASGTMIFSGLVWGTGRDWLRVGNLLLNDGVAPDGNRILPEGWVKMMRTPYFGAECRYGAGVWLYSGENVLALEGHDGQTVQVNFKKGTVYVRLGYRHGDTGPLSHILKDALPDVVDATKPAGNVCGL